MQTSNSWIRASRWIVAKQLIISTLRHTLNFNEAENIDDLKRAELPLGNLRQSSVERSKVLGASSFVEMIIK